MSLELTKTFEECGNSGLKHGHSDLVSGQRLHSSVSALTSKFHALFVQNRSPMSFKPTLYGMSDK